MYFLSMHLDDIGHLHLSRSTTQPVLERRADDPGCMVQGVWASKFNERAMLSMRKVGLDFRDLRMAVVVQVSLQPCLQLLRATSSSRPHT